MSYKALYRTYRPSSFDDVVGQKHIVATLKNAVKQNKIAHAYLFCGPRGTGKTSIAKLLAKAVNCENHENAPCGACKNCLSIQQGNHPDIVEIDAASNNGVDEIRDLIEKVKYSPIEGKYKVYIIDEVHMLSTGAFNALLKTLEEPPAHVLFVLATTEPHKVLPTIISRCQRYDFAKVEKHEMIKRIHQILKQEEIECDEEAIDLISTLADGGMRDALSILDQCIAYAENQISVKDVNEIYGITTTAEKLEILNNIFDYDAKSILNKIKIWNERGIDIRRLTADCIEIIKEAVIYGYTKDKELLIKLTEEEAKQILSKQTEKKLLEMIQVLMETTEKYRTATSVASYFEVAVLKLISIIKETNEKQQASFDFIKKEENQNKVVNSTTLVYNDEPIDILPIQEETKAELVIQEVSIQPKKPILSTMKTEDVLGLMVQGNKQQKLEDIEKWKKLDEKSRSMDLFNARHAALLKNTIVAVSGEEFILIATEYEALANEINDLKKEVEEFLRTCLEINKVLFVITQEEFKNNTEEFIERRKAGTLPPPLIIEKKEIEVKEEETKDLHLTKMKEMFGNDFEIVEEEE